MASATAVLQHKGESLGLYSRKRKVAGRPRSGADTDQRVYDIRLKYGFDSQQTFTRVFHPDLQSAAGRHRKENWQSCPLRAPFRFSVRAKTSDATPSSTRYSMAPSAEPQTKQHCSGLVEIHHMECLNQLLQAASLRDGAATADRRAEPEQDPGCFYLTVKLGWDFVQPSDSGYA